MTNEEKAKQIAAGTIIDGKVITYSDIKYDGAMKMAKWKDEDFAKEKQALIDKACEWLKENASKHIHGQYAFLKGLMIEEFKEAMKGE